MADFVAVLKKTIEGLSENTPEVRAKVYAKARATIDSKLAAITPPPPAAVAERQRQAIEDAIQAVEQFYAPPPEDELDELDTLFDDYKSDDDYLPEPPVEREQPAVLPRTGDFAVSHEPREDLHAREVLPGDEAETEPALDDVGHDRDRVFSPQPPYRPKQRRSVSGGLIAAVLALLVIGGGAYAAWSNQDALSAMLGLNGGAGDVAEGTDLPDDAAANKEPAADGGEESTAAGDPTSAADEVDQPEVASLP